MGVFDMVSPLETTEYIRYKLASNEAKGICRIAGNAAGMESGAEAQMQTMLSSCCTNAPNNGGQLHRCSKARARRVVWRDVLAMALGNC